MIHEDRPIHAIFLASVSMRPVRPNQLIKASNSLICLKHTRITIKYRLLLFLCTVRRTSGTIERKLSGFTCMMIDGIGLR